MAVLSLSEIPKLKELIKPYGYMIHVHDACGGQSFSLEPIDENLSDKVFEEVEKFFKLHEMTVKFFNDDKLDFIAR